MTATAFLNLKEDQKQRMVEILTVLDIARQDGREWELAKQFNGHTLNALEDRELIVSQLRGQRAKRQVRITQAGVDALVEEGVIDDAALTSADDEVLDAAVLQLEVREALAAEARPELLPAVPTKLKLKPRPFSMNGHDTSSADCDACSPTCPYRAVVEMLSQRMPEVRALVEAYRAVDQALERGGRTRSAR